MTQRDITKINPYQRPRYQRSEQAQHFVDYAKVNAPDIHRQIMQEETWMNARETSALDVEKILNNPAFIAWNHSYDEETSRERQLRLTNELALLGIAAGATKREIRNAYRRKARKLHPDAGGSEAAFKQLYAAYRQLLAIAKA